MARWGSDDLFYYSQIAGHIANGDGATFDGLHPTNGFQPLFMGVLIPFGKIFLNDNEAALRGLLLLASIITLISVFQAVVLFRRWGLEDLGMIFGAVLFIHPKILSISFHGTEAALTILMVVLALKAVQQIEQNRNLLLSSLVFTGLVLTRFDMSLLLAFLMLFLLWKRVTPTELISVGLLPGLAITCWLGLNWHFFGNFLPDSGAAKSLHGSFIAEMDGSGPLSHFFINFKGAVHTLLMAESKLSFVMLFLLALGLVRLFVIEHFTRYGSLSYLFILTCGGFAIMAAALVKLNGFRDWYLMPLYLVVIWLMSLGLETISRQFKYRGLVVVIFLLLIWVEAELHPRQHMAPYYLDAANHIVNNIPPGTKIGAFNAGLYGARLGGEYAVINLDGVVNHEVIEPLRSKQLGAFIDKKDIEYLVDHSGSIDFFSNFSDTNLHEQFNEIYKVQFEGKTSDITIYKRKSGH